MVRPVYKGRCARERIPGSWYAIPCQGYNSLDGVLLSLLYAINYDRVAQGKQPLAARDIDPQCLAAIDEHDWLFPSLINVLAFAIEGSADEDHR